MTGRKVLLAAIVAALFLLPLLPGANTYWLHVLNLTWIAAIAALGLNIVTGITGQIVLGQAALMGLGAYTAGLLMVKLQWPWYAAMPAALALAVLVGLALGLLALRIKGHYLAITTLAVNEIFRLVMLNEEPLTGGPMGLRDIPTFSLPLLGDTLSGQAYPVLLTVLLLALAGAVLLVRSHWGRRMRAVRDDELAAEAMGVNSPRIKILAFVIASVLGALAGCLYVLSTGFVSPNNFVIFESIKLVLMTVIGGLGSIGGTVLGAAVVTVLPELLRDLKVVYMAVFGLSVVLVLLAPRGLGVLGDWLLAPWLPQPEHQGNGGGVQSLLGEDESARSATVRPAQPPGDDAPRLLRVQGVSKHFGGIYALENVSFDVREGEILGVIGPNGSGKSTLINVCTGLIRADAGTLTLDGRDVTALPAWDIHDAGVARIFQNVRLWESMTVEENVMLAWTQQSGRHDEAAAKAAAGDALQAMGIGFLARRRAGDLSFGQSRLVELARATVTRPRLLLLDEPAAGLRGGLVMELAEILQRLRAQGTTVLVVEHRIKLVMALCDRVVVLNLGEKIAEGSAEAIGRDPQVIEAYLGERAGYDIDTPAPLVA